MLRIGRAATVAAEEQGATASQHLRVPGGHPATLPLSALDGLRSLGQSVETLLDPVLAHCSPPETL